MPSTTLNFGGEGPPKSPPMSIAAKWLASGNDDNDDCQSQNVVYGRL